MNNFGTIFSRFQLYGISGIKVVLNEIPHRFKWAYKLTPLINKILPSYQPFNTYIYQKDNIF